LAFLAGNPQLIGLPGGGIESNFIIVAGLYVPVAWLFGSAAGDVVDKLDRNTSGRILIAAVFAAAMFFGVRQQMRIIDPFFALVEPNDVAAFRWMRMNTPKSARIMINAFLAFEDKFAVVFLGEKRGAAGYGATELIPESWLRYHPDFHLAARFGNAQIWRFSRRPATHS
jgi:hypothetical protein